MQKRGTGSVPETTTPFWRSQAGSGQVFANRTGAARSCTATQIGANWESDLRDSQGGMLSRPFLDSENGQGLEGPRKHGTR